MRRSLLPMVTDMVMMTWLADVLRAAGLKVQETDGWKTRGRCEMGTVKGVLLHHTAGPAKGNAPSLKLVTEGRSDLPGPLSQLVLGRDGTFFVVAAGRCNHAGGGVWMGVNSGNSSFIGIEAENQGTTADPWPVEQMGALRAGVAAILTHIGATDMMVAGHREYALPAGRKIDPLFDCNQFRAEVDAIMAGKVQPHVEPRILERDWLMLQRGTQGPSVEMLQKALNLKAFAKLDVDGGFGGATEAAVKAFQSAKGLKVDGKVGPATWGALGFTNSLAA